MDPLRNNDQTTNLGDKRRLRFLIFIVVSSSTGLLIATLIFNWAPVPGIGEFGFWASISLLTSLAIIRLPMGSGVVTSLGEIVDLAAFATVGPYPVLIANIGGIIGRVIILGRSDSIRNIFNLCQWNLACLVAFFVLSAFQSKISVTFSLISFLAILSAWFVYSLMTTGFVSLAVAYNTNTAFRLVWRTNYLREVLISLASVPLAFIMAILFLNYGEISVLLLAIPLIGLTTLTGLWMERNRWQAKMERESQLAEMGKATASLLHELSRPLNRIVMISDHAIKGGANHKETLKQVLIEVRTASQLSEKLIGIMKIKLNRETIEISDLIQQLNQDLLLEQLIINVRDMNNTIGMYGNWDNELIIIALKNLIKNAWESQNSEGPFPELKVEIKSMLAQSVFQQAQYCQFSVRDYGPGLPMGFDSEIFEALYSTKESGFGIGLFLTNQIAKAHGGKLEAKNLEGKGSVFVLELPLVEITKKSDL